MNLKTKALMRLVFFSPKAFRVKPVREELVEVAYDCREQQEHRVLSHERLWQPGPSESVVHVVEDALLTTPEVVELHNCS